MVSLIFFLGFLLEDRVACNAASPAHFQAATITQGSHNKVSSSFFSLQRPESRLVYGCKANITFYQHNLFLKHHEREKYW